MKPTNKMSATKTVYLLIQSKSMLPVHGGIEVDVTTAFEVVGKWDKGYKEYVFSDCRAYFTVGNFDKKNTPFHCFESSEGRIPGFIPKIGDISTDDVLDTFQNELNAATPTSPEGSQYAKTVFQYWRGELQYDKVTLVLAPATITFSQEFNSKD